MASEVAVAEAAPAAAEAPAVAEVAAVPEATDEAAVEPEVAEAAPVAVTESFAREVGVIDPPPDIKMVIDRTADFVRRVGAAFEKEIMARNARNKKFGFLQPESPYHPYYQQRLKYGENVPGAAAAAELPDAPTDAEGATEKARKAAEATEVEQKRLATLKPKMPKTLKEKMSEYIKSIKTVKKESSDPPAPDKYSVTSPAMFAAADVEIIKLTAMFVARNGRSFLSGLTQREARNPQFDFLKPTHPLFGFFQQLVDAYAQIIIPPKALLAEIAEKSNSPMQFLAEALARAKFQKVAKENDVKKEQNDEDERVAMALIDWHQFCVVETIAFDQGEEDFLPMPKRNILDITYMLESQHLGGAGGGGAGEGAEQDELDMDMDMDMDEDAEPDEVNSDDEPEKDDTAYEAEAEAVLVNRVPGDYADDDDDYETSKASSGYGRLQKCPICGENIPVDELSEHMRIELLDPRWKEQKQLLKNRQNESSLSSNADISANLGRMAKTRSDVFVGRNEARDEKEDDEREARALEYYEKHRKQLALDNQAKAAAQPKPSAQQYIPAPVQPRPPMRPTLQQPRPPMTAPPLPSQPAPPTMPSIRPPSSAPPTAPAVPTPAPPAGAPPQQGMMQQQQGMQGMMGGMRPGMPMMGYPGMQQQGMRPGMPGMPGMMPGMPGMPGMQYQQQQAPQAQPQTAAHQAPSMSNEPAAKKARLEEPGSASLVEESQWLQMHPGPVTLQVAMPSDAPQFNCNGQYVSFNLQATDTVETLKARIGAANNDMPASKMKINVMNGAFLNKDKFTLAHYNIASGAVLVLGVRERGGRKK